MGIMEEMIILLLLITGSLGQSHDPRCTVICDQQRSDIRTVMEGLKSSDVFCIMAGSYTLKHTAVLNNVNNVNVIGINGTAVISCENNVGMAIINVQQFQMEDITLNGCALTGDIWYQKVAPMIEKLLNFTDVYYIPGEVGKALTIVGSRDVTLNHVNVQNSVGMGLLALSMIGQSSLLHCTFDRIVDDNCSQSSNNLSCISGAAIFYFSDLNSNNEIQFSDNNSILIDDCSFQNSTSHSNYVALELSDGLSRLNVSVRVNNQSLYPLDGSAGLSVIMDRHYTDSRQYMVVKNSRFLNNCNFAAGCVFVQVNEYTTHFSLHFINNSFTNCSGTLYAYGGAMFIVFGYKLYNSFNMAGTSLYNTTVAIVGNIFEDNSAFWGGGIAIVGAPGQLSAKIPQRSITINENTFIKNKAITGFALAIWESSSHGGRRIYGLDIHLHNNWFEDNQVVNDNSTFSTYNHFNTGTMYIDSSYVILTGDHLFYHNRGAILATRSVIEVKDNCVLNITENIALTGAGADLRDGSFFIIKDNAIIQFQRNFSPLRGGGVNLLNIRGWPLQFRDGCIFYFNEFSYCPSLVQQGCMNLTQLYNQSVVKGQVIFDNNDAGISGKAMYGVQLLDCPWFQFDKNNFLDRLSALNHTIKFNPPLNNQASVVSTPRVALFLKEYSPVRVMPGHRVIATISVEDELGDFTPSEVSVEIQDGNRQGNNFTIDGRAQTFVIGNNSQVELKFFGLCNQMINFSLFSVQSYRLPLNPSSVYLTDCNAGFVFEKASNSCMCDPNLLQASDGISCSNNGTILLERNLWAGALINTRTGDSEYVASFCYLQYCDDNAVELTDLSDPEVQCNFHHSGFLCGTCSNGFSDVFGSTRCRQCSDAYIATILLFAFLGILLVVVLFFGHITVSVGLFNGVILYANAVSLYAFLLYPNNYNPSLNPATVMLSWLNLNLGFELCFYDGMTSLVEVVFRLLFPFYLLFLLVVIVMVLRHSRLRYLSRSPVPVLSTIIWLSYSSLFQTSVEILGFVPITLYPSKDMEARWLQDPSIHYATGGHLALFIISLLLMIFVLIPLPLLLLFYHRLTNRLRWLHKIHPFVDAFYGPFKLRYYYWIGLRLLFRMGLVVFGHFGQQLIVSDLRQYFTLLICFYVCGLLVFQAMLQPYKSTLVNILDIFYLTNLTFLFMSAMYFAALGVGRDNKNDRAIQIVHTSVSLGLTLLVFGVVLLWYVLGQLHNYLAKRHPQISLKSRSHRGKSIFALPGTLAEQLLDYKDREIPETDNKVSENVDTDEDGALEYNRMRESLLSEDGI